MKFNLILHLLFISIATPIQSHTYAPCKNNEQLLQSSFPTSRQWQNSFTDLPVTYNCLELEKQGGCEWFDDRSVYLRPWRQACPEACNLCEATATKRWRAPHFQEILQQNVNPQTFDLENKCDIARVKVTTHADRIRIHQEYINKSIPVIVTGLINASTWKLSSWIKHATAENSTTRTISILEDPVINFLQQEYRRVQLLGYNQYGDLESYPEHDSNIRQQLEHSYTKHTTIMGNAHGTSSNGGDMLRSTCNDFQPEWSHHWILIAGQGTSTAWHVDQFNSSAWNTVLHGNKRWSLGPPSRYPPGIINPLEFKDVLKDSRDMKKFDYFNQGDYGWGDEMPWSMSSSKYSKQHAEYIKGLKTLPTNSTKPLECMLRPGETIFVPSGWWHTVYNVETSIAITENIVTASNFMKVLTELMARPKGSLPFKCAKRLVDKYPELVTDWLYRFGIKWRKLPLSFRSRVRKKMKQKEKQRKQTENQKMKKEL